MSGVGSTDDVKAIGADQTSDQAVFTQRSQDMSTDAVFSVASRPEPARSARVEPRHA